MSTWAKVSRLGGVQIAIKPPEAKMIIIWADQRGNEVLGPYLGLPNCWPFPEPFTVLLVNGTVLGAREDCRSIPRNECDDNMTCQVM